MGPRSVRGLVSKPEDLRLRSPRSRKRESKNAPVCPKGRCPREGLPRYLQAVQQWGGSAKLAVGTIVDALGCEGGLGACLLEAAAAASERGGGAGLCGFARSSLPRRRSGPPCLPQPASRAPAEAHAPPPRLMRLSPLKPEGPRRLRWQQPAQGGTQNFTGFQPCMCSKDSERASPHGR